MLLPYMQAVYGVLKEAEHRSTFYIPYWNLPFAKNLVPRQRQFYSDLAVINDCLDGLIARAKSTRQIDDAEALQARDYSKVQHTSAAIVCARCLVVMIACARHTTCALTSCLHSVQTTRFASQSKVYMIVCSLQGIYFFSVGCSFLHHFHSLKHQ